MEIKGIENQGVTLSQLSAGAVFWYNGEFYMTTDEENVINLQSGCLTYLDNRCRVILVRGYFQITE